MSVWSFSPQHPEGALKSRNIKNSSLHKSVPWEHLPHGPLSFEITARTTHREPSETDHEVKQEYLRERLRLLEPGEHDVYINCVARNLKRELRICRDVYRDYLRTVNNRSITAKARVALDFGVAPMASSRLREEIIVYVRAVGVSDLVFAILFWRLADLLLMNAFSIPDWLEIGKVVRILVPNNCFQELKEVTSREIARLASGPFGSPAQPFERLYVSEHWDRFERIPNAIWDHRNSLLAYQLWRLWDFVFREICDQHAAIDCEEHSNIALALIALNPFERLAGRLFYEASEADGKHVPDDVFIRMGQQLDAEHISLADTLDGKGKMILQHLRRKGKSISTWAIALADKSHREFLPENAKTRVEATTLRQFGTLSRCAKRTFYQAKDAYHQALERVYEQRVPASICKNTFGSRVASGQWENRRL